MSTARLQIVVDSSGVRSADKDLKQLTATAKETEKQQKHMADVFAEMVRAEEKEAAKAAAAAEKKAAATEKAAARAAAVAEKEAQRAAAAAERQAAAASRQAAREAEQWNDAKQKAIARYERESEAAEKAAARKLAAAEKAAKREDELWNNAIQRAKAGLDGVLPIRPSLQRIEAKLNEAPSHSTGGAVLEGLKEGGASALSSIGMGALAGGAAGVAAVAVEHVTEKLVELKNEVIANLIEDDKLIARLGGVTDSAEAAGETFEDLQKQTFGKLPSKIDEVANAFIQLGNNGLQNGQSALKAYSNIAAQTGASLGTVASAVQAATLGNYKSLREFGIRVKEEGDNLQVTFRGQTEIIAGGAESIEAYMQRLGTVQFAGAVERQMDTIGGTVKKTQDAWEKFINAVGDSTLGSIIQSSVGASIGVIDAMTASVEALFDKAHKGMREMEADKRRAEEQSKLDKTMMSWADPSVSKSEAARLAAVIDDHRQSAADKTLATYTKQLALLQQMKDLGETQLPNGMSLSDAETELTRQYMRDSGGAKTKADVAFVLPQDDSGFARYHEMRAKQDADDLRSVRESLAKKKDADEEFYKHNKEILEQSTSDQTELLAANEVAWDKHVAEKKAKLDKEQLDLQKRLQSLGVETESQFQVTNRKYAGQQMELGAALSDNMSGKNGVDLQLAAEQTYADKSVAIERARAEEIAQINRTLVQQSATNASAMFGSLATAMKNAHGAQSKEYATMFAAEKAFALVSAEASMFQSMAEANKQPFPANIPLYLKAAAQGAQLIAQISSLSYSGSFDSGGSIGADSYGDVGERRPELLLVHGRSQVQGPATVIGGAATADILGKGSSGQPLRIVNAFDGGETVRGFLGSTQGERVLVNFIKRNGSLIRSVAR